MKVFILLSDDPIFKPRLLYQIILRSDCEICGVGQVAAPKRGGFIQKLKFNILFWGTWQFTVIALAHLFYKIIDKLPVTPSINILASIRRVCQCYGIPYYHINDVNSSEMIQILKKTNIDIILSFQHQIFREKILSTPAIACINCHPALLPAYRGVKPIFWAMLNGEKAFGVTVHTMKKEIDCGKIISQKKMKLIKNHTLFQNYIAAYEISADVIVDALIKLTKTPLSDFIDMTYSAQYYHEPQKEDLVKFRMMGLRSF